MSFVFNGNNMLTTTDGTGTIGAASATRPATIYLQSGVDVTPTSIATSQTEAKSLVLRNATAAANGAQQYSPSIYLAAKGWDADDAVSRESVMRITNQTTQGNTVVGSLVFAHSLAGGAYSDLVQLTSAANLLWSSDGVGDIGASGGTRPANLYLTGEIQFGTGVGILKNADPSTGLGTALHWKCTAAQSIQIISTRASGATNCIIAVADVNAATISDAHQIMHFGWTNNSDVFTPTFAVKPQAVKFVKTFAVASAPTGAEGDLGWCTNGNAGSPCLAAFSGGSWLRIAFGAAISAT